MVICSFFFFFVEGDSVGLYTYSFVDDGEQSSFAWPQKKKKEKQEGLMIAFFLSSPFLKCIMDSILANCC
jgi:hypothetical protein